MNMLALSAAPNYQDFTLIDGTSLSKKSTCDGCGYCLGHLPPDLRAPWLRVFFVILYKVTVKLLVCLSWVCQKQWVNDKIVAYIMYILLQDF